MPFASRGRCEPVSVPGADAHNVQRALGTERTYFELGARIEQLPGAIFAWMPGLTASPGGAVVHRVQQEVVASLGQPWIDQAEDAFAAVGAGLARIYVDQRDSAADRAFRAAGYVPRDELVFVHSLPEPSAGVTLRPVVKQEDWSDKLRLHEAVESPPDGHQTSALEWVELEQRKCSAGMEAFLAETDGEVVGAIGAVWGDEILRLKNLVVRPDRRRRAVGQAMICATAAMGKERGIGRQCVFAVRGEAGEFLYRAAGMHVAGIQVEWSKPLPRGH